jgi:hypothetical protein
MFASMNDPVFAVWRCYIDSLTMQTVLDRRGNALGIPVVPSKEPAAVNWRRNRRLHGVELLFAC